MKRYAVVFEESAQSDVRLGQNRRRGQRWQIQLSGRKAHADSLFITATVVRASKHPAHSDRQQTEATRRNSTRRLCHHQRESAIPRSANDV